MNKYRESYTYMERQGFIFNFSVGGKMVPPLRGGTRGEGQQPIGGGMARDAFATFKKFKFKP